MQIKNNDLNKNYIIANWKMNGTWQSNADLLKTLKEGTQFLEPNSKANVAICPPHPYLIQAKGLLQNSQIAWGAQDVSQHQKGAYTGDVSVDMIKDLEATYAIIGHSERREYQHESNTDIAAKLQRVLDAGLTPIICVGENLAQRENQETLAFIEEQLKGVLAVLKNQANKLDNQLKIKNVLIAYEPIWAIGTGLTANATQVEEVCAFIQQQIQQQIQNNFSVLYGGSVKANNAAELIALPSVNGFLVGGASLIADEFLAIIQAAN